MDKANFVDSIFGSASQEPGNKHSFVFYLPKPIPRDLELKTPVIAALSDADAALGNLQGLGTLINEPSLLIGPYLKREALASSRIEGTQASLSDVFQSEIDARSLTSDTLEVSRYLQATERAYLLAESLPLAQRLILDVHAILLQGVRGEERLPGEIRRSPVWVGHATSTPETAIFVPPLPQYLGELLKDWEQFVNVDGNSLPALIQAALMHYQFETIHPFLDGNGRIGRLLINLLLKQRGRMPYPLLYLSNYFETHRDEYYERLQAVRERAEIDEWLLFFMRAVTAQANDAITRARKLVAIREDYQRIALQERSNLPRLVDIIVKNPFVTAKSIEQQLQITNQGARNLIKKAEARSWLHSLGNQGRGGREIWVATEILNTIEAPVSYERHDAAQTQH